MNKKNPKVNIFKYVSYSAETNKSKCLVKNCNKELPGKRPANIKRHYTLVHKVDIFNSEESETPMQKQDSNKIRTKLYSNLNKTEFIKSCAEIVTLCSVPFNGTFNRECFRQIIEPYEDSFNVKINERSIVNILNGAANNLREALIKRLSSKVISLKVDIASRLERSILGVNVQYIRDNKIQINTIGSSEEMFLLYPKNYNRESNSDMSVQLCEIEDSELDEFLPPGPNNNP